jgi:hypothetical protein
MSDLRTFKLATGEEIVAEVVEQQGDSVSIKNPVKIAPQMTQNGPVLGFAPWIHSANTENPLYLHKEFILVMLDTAEEVKNGYNQIFGAGLVVPSKQLITG